MSDCGQSVRVWTWDPVMTFEGGAMQPIVCIPKWEYGSLWQSLSQRLACRRMSSLKHQILCLTIYRQRQSHHVRVCRSPRHWEGSKWAR